MYVPPVINHSRCLKCGTCARICPLNVLYQPAPKANITVRYPDECWHCRACALDCPGGAITVRYPLSHMILHYEKKEGGESL